MSPKISVVIPAYNEEKVIAQVIQAVLKQDYDNFEVIVVNNASTDRTEEIARSFPVTVVNEFKKGLPQARERGRLEATGEIVANLDSDCIPDPDWLSKGVRLFTKQTIAAVTGPYDYFDASFSFRIINLLLHKYAYSVTNIILQLPFIKKGAVFIGGNNFIRTEALKKVGGYNTSILFYGEDTDTGKRISQVGRIVFSPRLVMKTSSRRFQNEGILKIFANYFLGFFNTLFVEDGQKKLPKL